MIIPIEFSSMSIQEIMRRGWREKTTHRHQVGDGTTGGREMERWGWSSRSMNPGGGSLGSCVAEECWLGWKALSTDLAAAKYTLLGLLLPRLNIIVF